MITIISPTTTMNFDKNKGVFQESSLYFIDEVHYLINLLKKLSIDGISDLMNLSNDLATLNFDRYQSFNSNNNPTLQSIYAFEGEVFRSMNVDSFNLDDIKFANKHFKILSGLYGVLSPLDKIQPYRLEMKAKLENKYGKDLYKFWKPKVTDLLINTLNNHENKIIINLASSEYKKSLDIKKIEKTCRLIDIVFKEYNPVTDKYVVKGLYAKRARGYLAEYIISNKIDQINSIKKFNKEGYSFNIALSNENTLTFTR